MDIEQIWEYADRAEEMLEESTKINALSLKLTDSEPDIFTSKIGGTPYIPREMTVPIDKNGKQLKLLAQIDCELLSGLPDYPHKGMLQFWLSTKYPWKDWKIIYHKNIDRTVTEAEILSKVAYFVEGETGEFPVINGGYGIESELVEESMSRSDERCGMLLCKYLAEIAGDKIFEEYDGDISNLFDPDISSYHHKLGGYQYDPQAWLRYRYEPKKPVDIGTDDEWLLLFQLEYEHGLGKNWADNAKIIMGDCGVMHFFIKRKDLKALDFDKAEYNWSCS